MKNYEKSHILGVVLKYMSEAQYQYHHERKYKKGRQAPRRQRRERSSISIHSRKVVMDKGHDGLHDGTCLEPF